MENQSIELSLLEPEEREQLEYIWSLIPEQDQNELSKDDVLFVLDSIDDYLEQAGLLRQDEKTGEVEYLDGDIDEDEQLNYIYEQAQADHRSLKRSHIQLILDGEVEYGIQQGWYEEE